MSPLGNRETLRAFGAGRARTRPRRLLTFDDGPTDRRARLTRTAVRVASLVALGLAWWLVTELEVWQTTFVPSPGAVWDRFVQSVTTRTSTTESGLELTQRGLRNFFLWQHWWASVSRLLWGIAWAVVVGVPLGLLLATVRPFRLVVEPYLDFLRSLPPLAYFSLLVLWFGIGNTSKVWLLFLAALAPIALSIVSGARGIPRDRVLAVQSLGAGRLAAVRHLVIPSVLPDFFVGLRLAVGFAMTTIVAAETTDGIPGLGGLAWVAKKQQQSDTVVLCILLIGVTAVGLDLAIRTLDRKLVPWRGRA